MALVPTHPPHQWLQGAILLQHGATHSPIQTHSHKSHRNRGILCQLSTVMLYALMSLNKTLIRSKVNHILLHNYSESQSLTQLNMKYQIMFPVTDKTDKNMSKLTFFPSVYPSILTRLIFHKPKLHNKTALHPTLPTNY